MDKLESLKFIEFGVLIQSDEVDSALVNETLLRGSDIIETSDETRPGSMIVTPFHSRIEFTNGLEIAAVENRLWFTQRSEFSEQAINRCPDLAMRFIENLNLRMPITSVDTIFKAVVPYSAKKSESKTTSRFFTNCAEWSNWHGMTPKLSFKAIYRRKNTTTTLVVGTAMKAGDKDTMGELYEVNFHHELLMSSPDLKYSCTMDILSNARHDMDNFKRLISTYQLV